MRRTFALLAVVVGLAACSDNTNDIAVGPTPTASGPTYSAEDLAKARTVLADSPADTKKWRAAVVLTESLSGPADHRRWQAVLLTRTDTRVVESGNRETAKLDLLLDRGDLVRVEKSHLDDGYLVTYRDAPVVLRKSMFG